MAMTVQPERVAVGEPGGAWLREKEWRPAAERPLHEATQVRAAARPGPVHRLELVSRLALHDRSGRVDRPHRRLRKGLRDAVGVSRRYAPAEDVEDQRAIVLRRRTLSLAARRA